MSYNALGIIAGQRPYRKGDEAIGLEPGEIPGVSWGRMPVDVGCGRDAASGSSGECVIFWDESIFRLTGKRINDIHMASLQEKGSGACNGKFFLDSEPECGVGYNRKGCGFESTPSIFDN